MTPLLIVETNFIVRMYEPYSIADEEEESNPRTDQVVEANARGRILDLTCEGRLDLAIPAFSIYEAKGTIRGGRERRRKLIDEMLREQRILLVNPGVLHPPEAIAAFRASVVQLESRQETDYSNALATILKVARIIPLDASVAEAVALNRDPEMRKDSDAVVLHSVLGLLATIQPSGVPRGFLNYDRKDFHQEPVRARLRDRGCELFGSARDVLGRFGLV